MTPQEKRIQQLEKLLDKTQKFLNIIALDGFIYNERFYECFYCGSDDPQHHTAVCASHEAMQLRLDIERALLKQPNRSGG